MMPTQHAATPYSHAVLSFKHQSPLHYTLHHHRMLSSSRWTAQVKMVVFATYYQSLGVQFIPGVAPESLDLWNDYILCLEMVAFSVLHARHATATPLPLHSHVPITSRPRHCHVTATSH